MSKHAAILIGIIGAVLTASASAAESQSTPALMSPDARKNPYASLFTTRRQVKTPAAPHQSSPPTPSVRNGRVVCGTIVIPADPSVDRKIVIPIPESAERSRIRIVEPPACSRN